jgi:amino acid transporter
VNVDAAFDSAWHNSIPRHKDPRLVYLYAGPMRETQIEAGLVRSLGVWEAVAANMVSMIGSAVFVSIPLVLSAMGGPQAFLGWLLGMFIALADGLIWAELGVAMPTAGGTYVYLGRAFGKRRLGRLMSFVFLWGAAISFPLISALIAVSFAQYAHYLWTAMTEPQGKMLAAALCLGVTALLYREISSVGRLTVAIFAVVMATLVLIVATCIWHFNSSLAFDLPPGAFRLSSSFVAGLASATIVAALDYGGYCNICFIAGEVDRPRSTIPRAVMYSISLIAIFYLLLSTAVVGIIPWRSAMTSTTVITDVVRKLHGPLAAQCVTLLILFATAGSLFTSLLGFSRVLYAGAVDGQFFSLFARLHSTKRFPAGSVLLLGTSSAALCVFDLQFLIRAISAVSTLTLAIPQVVALMVIRRYRPEIDRPFRMAMYPLPALVALAGWIFVFLGNELWIIVVAFGVTAAGVAMYLWRARNEHCWPFAPDERGTIPHD